MGAPEPVRLIERHAEMRSAANRSKEWCSRALNLDEEHGEDKA